METPECNSNDFDRLDRRPPSADQSAGGPQSAKLNHHDNLRNESDLGEKSSDLNDDSDVIMNDLSEERSQNERRAPLEQHDSPTTVERSTSDSVPSVVKPVCQTDGDQLSVSSADDEKSASESNGQQTRAPEPKRSNSKGKPADGEQRTKDQHSADKQAASPADSETKESGKLNSDDIEEGSGFPKCFDGWVIRGKTIPINKKTWNDIEVDGNDAILDCVSQVAPILLKKPNIFPARDDKAASKAPSKESKKELTESKEESEEKPVDEQKSEENKSENNKNEDKKDEDKKDDSNEKQPTKSPKESAVSNSMLMISDYYSSSVGNFLMGIGLSRCKEALHKDAVRQTQRLIRREGERAEYQAELEKHTQKYQECKGANSIFNFEQLRCGLCDFKTESEAVLEGHYLTPHLSNRKEFKCNFCPFVTRDARIIVYHSTSEHKKHCNVQMPNVLYECPTCEYESNQKSKAANHMSKCVKQFVDDNAEEKTQHTAENENEYPAITPKPISQEILKLFNSTREALKPVVMNPKTPMPTLTGLPQASQLQILAFLKQEYDQQKLKLNKALATKLTNQHNSQLRAHLQQQQANMVKNLLMANPNAATALASLSNPNLIRNLSNSLNSLSNLGSLTNSNNLNSPAKTAPQLYNMLQNGSQIANNTNRNRLSTNSNQQTAQQKPDARGLLTNQTAVEASPSGVPSNPNAARNGCFVICEICDGYIKDLELLRHHMNVVHKVSANLILPSHLAGHAIATIVARFEMFLSGKFYLNSESNSPLFLAHRTQVKIHQKMLSGRPPLNCQKCEWRFFTDQGLERHLLGTHGLVTSNMQNMADKHQDGGRCIICGSVFARNLVSHMNQVSGLWWSPIDQ